MKPFRLCVSLLLCLCLCAALFSVCALAEEPAGSSAESSAESVEDGTQLSPVEQVFQVIALLILFGGLAMLPVYYVLNRRRRRIIESFEQQKQPEDTPKDKTDE